MVSRNAWYGAAAVIIVIIIVAAFSYYYVFLMGPSKTPNVTLAIYEGEISSSQYGFGVNSTTLSSPGPTLNFHVNDVVNVTIYVIGSVDHAWAITSTNSSTGTVMWGAQVGSSSNPLSPQTHGSVIFTVGNAGNYFYVCPVSGHTDLGMWGQVVVT